MIKYLRIENFIIVKKLIINFDNGLQVLTGETGAGKSIIIGALSILLGKSVKKGLLFDDTKSGYIEAGFTFTDDDIEIKKMLHKHSIEIENNEIFFAKEITTSNKGKSFINGRRVTNNIVKEFSDMLIDFHSQRDQILLLDSAYQLSILDKYAQIENQIIDYQSLYEMNIELRKQLRKLQKIELDNNQKNELYHYQLDEINRTKLKIGEYKILQNEYNILSNAEDILNLTQSINFSLYENEKSMYDKISNFSKKVVNYADDNKHLKILHELLEEIKVSIEGVNSEIESLDGVIELDEKRLDEVVSRLDNLNSLSKKYNLSIDQIIDHKKVLEENLANFQSVAKEIETKKNEINKNNEKLIDSAVHLSDLRKIASKKLIVEIEKNLKILSIPDIQFEIKFSDLRNANDDIESLTDLGFDEIDFYMSANKGIATQSMKFAASGGELSRILLTVKTILSKLISGRTIIFDEIDSGVGGKTAEVLGRFIKRISRNHQVLLITHLPQVAAYSDLHFVIKKQSKNKKTEVLVILLDEKHKIEEIARMLSGSLSSASIEHATELLNKKEDRK